jgi:hypothetical protein
MIDPTYISTARFFWCATYKYMLLAIESVEDINRWPAG